MYLKGLSHEMDLAFDDMHAWLVLGLNRRRDHFLNLMLAACTEIVNKDWDISSGIGPCFPLAGEQCKLYANAGGKMTNAAPTAASQPTFINAQLYST